VFATAAVLAACGGSGSGSVPIITTQANNVVSVVVDAGPAQLATGAVDTIYTTITICAPGSTSNCQTIDHIQVDTGSSGLRILGSVLSGSLGLPTVNDNVSGNAIAECAQFADGYSWGPLRQADLQVGGEKAQSLNVQVIGDTTYTTVPADCSSTGGTQEDTVAAFGANGILGVGPFIQDCGPICAASVEPAAYYVCPTPSTCQNAAIATALQVNNPVASFTTDNNGVLIMLPSVPTGGAANVMGSLIFGIGTQTNNALGTATVLTVDPNIGVITTNYLNATLQDGVIDSGSNGIFFTDPSIATCSVSSDFYCPNSTLSRSGTNIGFNNAQSTVNFSVGNADNLFNGNVTFTAFNDIGGTNPDPQGFDWGVPFFFGRHVFTAIEGASTPGGAGPYFAY